MKKENIFWLAIVCSIFGPTILGFGIGKIFGQLCEGTSIGLGVGLSIIAFSLFRVFRRIEAFEKKS